MRAFANAVRGERTGVLTAAKESVESHLMAFAAERARAGGEVVEMAAYRRSL
jgi:hypothetical protein